MIGGRVPITRSLNFDRIADSYDQTRGGEERGARFAKELHPFLDPGRPMLEIGIGTGVVALGLRGLGHRVVGVDLSLSMLRHAADRLGPRVAAGDARRLPLAEAAVGQVYSVWVLHVVGDVPALLAEVARVLRPGGRYLVVPGFTPEPGDPIGRLVLDLQLRVDPEGRRRDDPARVRDLAPAAGLRFVERRPLAAYDYEESPAEEIRKIESRSLSWLWNVPDDRWDEVVGPALAGLRALPHPDRPIARRSSHDLMLLERP